MAVLILIPFDPAAHEEVGDLQRGRSLVALEMTPRQGAAHALDELRHEREEIALGIAEDLEGIPAGSAALQLEGFERNALAVEAQAKM